MIYSLKMDFFIFLTGLFILIVLFTGVFSDCKRKGRVAPDNMNVNRRNFFNEEIDRSTSLNSQIKLEQAYSPKSIQII